MRDWRGRTATGCLLALLLLATACGSGVAPSTAPRTLTPRPQITDGALAATSESSIVSAQQTVDAANAQMAQMTVDAAHAQATAAAVVATQRAAGQATIYAATAEVQATEQAIATATAVAQAQATAQAVATAEARQATATESSARVTATAVEQAAVIAAQQTKAVADLQLTRVAATAEAEARQQQREQATDLFWTWFPIVLLIGLVALLAIVAYVGLRLLDLRGRVINGADGVTSLALPLPGGRGFVVHVPSRQLWPAHVIDGTARNLPVAERTQAALVAQDHATRAIRGLPEGAAGRGAGELVAGALARPQADERDRLTNIVVLEAPQAAPDLIPPRLLAAAEHDWSEVADDGNDDEL
jgi:hypothetical protein